MATGRFSRLLRRTRSNDIHDAHSTASTENPLSIASCPSNDDEDKHAGRMMLPRSLSAREMVGQDGNDNINDGRDSDPTTKDSRLHIIKHTYSEEKKDMYPLEIAVIPEADTLPDAPPVQIATIRQLAQMAAMSSEEYQTKLMDNQLPGAHHGDDDPDLSKLTQSIHRLQSSNANLARENDHQTVEIQELRAQIEMQQAALTKLHTGNVKLRQRLARKDEKIAKLKSTSERPPPNDFLQQLHQHEQALLVRQRADTGGSNTEFSEADGLQDYTDMSSVSTTSSFITDDGIATIKLHKDRAQTWPKPGDSGSFSDLDIISSVAPMKNMLSSSTFSNLLGPKTGQLYNLTMTSPLGLQFARIPLDAQDNEFAFAVCGYEGFDANRNMRPTEAARLLQINGKDVGATWTLEELRTALDQAGKNLRLRFRNDEWTPYQKGLLSEQMVTMPAASSSRGRSLSGDAKQHLLNFWHHASAPEITGGEDTSPKEKLNNVMSRLKLSPKSPKRNEEEISNPDDALLPRPEIIITKPPGMGEEQQQPPLSGMKLAMSKNMGKLFAFRP